MSLYNEGYLRVPHLLNVSIAFTPIHNFNVSSQVQNYIGGDSDFTVRPKRQKAAAIESRGVQSFETQGPQATTLGVNPIPPPPPPVEVTVVISGPESDEFAPITPLKSVEPALLLPPAPITITSNS